MSDKEYPVTYRKAIKGSVGGRQLIKRGDGYVEAEFLLQGDPAIADPDDITLEIADEECEKYFTKYNKPAIQNGYLIEVADYVQSVDSTNAVGDGYLKDLLKMPFQKMVKEVKAFTSPVPVYRLLAFAEEDNKPIKTIEFLRETASSLEK